MKFSLRSVRSMDCYKTRADMSIHLQLVYEHEDKKLVLDPLTGEIDPDNSDFTIGKFKVEVRLRKISPGRWVRLVGESQFPFRSARIYADNHAAVADQPPIVSMSSHAPSTPSTSAKHKPRKNWDDIAEDAIKAEPEKSPDDDPNAGGDTAVNGFFQKLFANADDDTKKAMMKSYQESGGTTLSTNWADVGKKTVEVKPPEGSEWRKWG